MIIKLLATRTWRRQTNASAAPGSLSLTSLARCAAMSRCASVGRYLGVRQDVLGSACGNLKATKLELKGGWGGQTRGREDREVKFVGHVRQVSDLDPGGRLETRKRRPGLLGRASLDEHHVGSEREGGVGLLDAAVVAVADDGAIA